MPIKHKKIMRNNSLYLGTNPSLHAVVIEEEHIIRQLNTPSITYILTICLLIAIAAYLIVESYNRGLRIAMELNQSIVDTTENNQYFGMLSEILNDQEYPNNEGYIWNLIAKAMGLPRMPNLADTYAVSERLLVELTRDATGGLNKALIHCGHVIIPQRYEYPAGVQGLFQFNAAVAIARATNIAAGTEPFQCALQITGARASLKITNFIATAMIESTTLMSRISVIKKIISTAIIILAFAIPNACLLVNHALSDDSALLALRNNPEQAREFISVNEQLEIENFKEQRH